MQMAWLHTWVRVGVKYGGKYADVLYGRPLFWSHFHACQTTHFIILLFFDYLPKYFYFDIFTLNVDKNRFLFVIILIVGLFSSGIFVLQMTLKVLYSKFIYIPIYYWLHIALNWKWMTKNLSRFQFHFSGVLKTVAFIAGKKNPAIQKIFIRFSIEIKLEKLFQRWDSIQNSI